MQLAEPLLGKEEHLEDHRRGILHLLEALSRIGPEPQGRKGRLHGVTGPGRILYLGMQAESLGLEKGSKVDERERRQEKLGTSSGCALGG